MRNTKQFLGARIQEIRKSLGIKQSELAEKVGVDPKYISKVECGRCFPSFELLDKIAETLDKPVVDFFSTEHLIDRNELLNKLIQRLSDAPEEKFRIAYKILNEIL